MKTYTKESLLKELINIRERGWITTRRKNNDGGVGNTLEDLLEIEENNLPLPNAAEWELKAQRKNTTSLVTLFHMEPSPRAFKFVPSIFLPEFGWQPTNKHKNYSAETKSFRQTISTKDYSNRGFIVQVDRTNRKVLIHFDPQKIDKEVHPQWHAEVLKKLLDPQPYWGFDDLFHKAGAKLHNCFFVTAEAKRIKKQLCFHYQDIYMLKNLNIDKFIDAIDKGNLYIDFDARTGHNHGTKFRLRSEAFVDLYAKIKKY
ncbi:MAG: MvaI/BcnI restriction endonuclease family protein [Proteobacteria bacterium]|nr:MvaI/BcnI restriction endonuclease family protein [Pseudomonadota bacterium]